MNNTNWYVEGNNLQYRDVDEVVKEYIHLMKFSETGGDVIMDIGCGDGKVTINILHKRLPSNIKKLIAVDLLPQMIEYSKATYSNKNVEFQIMDVAGEVNDEYMNCFDKVFSFLFLHWVQNQRKALTNIWSMLKDKGDCLLCFNGKNPMYEVFLNTAEKKRWSSYCKNVKEYISPYHLSKDPVQMCKSLMEDIGFRYVQVEDKNMTYHFHGKQNFKRFVFGIDPFLKGIPATEHDDYFEDMLKEVQDLKMVAEANGDKNDNDIIIELKYIVIICFATK